MKYIEQGLGEIVVVTNGAEALMRTELSKVIYETAKTHSQMASEIAGKDENVELKHSLVAILLAYTTLEAYINTYGKDRLKPDIWQEKFLNPKVSTESKWLGIPRSVTTKSLNKGKEPFKSFKKLEELRHYIVHFDPKFTPAVVTGRSGMTEARSLLTPQKSQWACNVAKSMIVALHALDNSEAPGWIE